MAQLNINANNRLKLNVIRVLFLGDPGVGKTSLIYCLANDEYKSGLPAKIADQTIPAKDAPENVPLLLIDSSRRQVEKDLKDSIRCAHVICLVYTLKDEEGFKRVLGHWIPLIREHQTNYSDMTYKPVILVANKSDSYESKFKLEGVLAKLRKIVEIQSYFEASAKKRVNVREMLSSAQRAVMYPASPLIDGKGKMRHEFIMALKQIFRAIMNSCVIFPLTSIRGAAGYITAP